MVETNRDTVQTTKTTQQVGNTEVHKETVVASQQVDPKEFKLAKINQFLWLIIHLIGIIILLRFVFLLFGANLYGFAAIIFNISTPFVRPFQGIFAAPSTNGSYFDSAALLALAIWYLLGFILTYIITLFSNRVTAEEVV